MFELKDRIAVVTGAGRGNGAAIASGLVAAGARVWVTDLDAGSARETAVRIGAEHGCGLDVTDPAAGLALARDVASHGPAHLLVNNAGIICRAAPDAPDYEEGWARVMAVNLDGMRHMVGAFRDQLAASGGSIVNIGSIMSVTAGPGLTAYAASKGAVAQYTRALAHDMAPLGVRVNAVLPGVIATPMTQTTRDTPHAIGRFLAHTPMGRVGQPEELAGPVIFLASRAASYVTGALLPVDGGYLAA